MFRMSLPSLLWTKRSGRRIFQETREGFCTVHSDGCPLVNCSIHWLWLWKLRGKMVRTLLPVPCLASILCVCVWNAEFNQQRCREKPQIRLRTQIYRWFLPNSSVLLLNSLMVWYWLTRGHCSVGKYRVWRSDTFSVISLLWFPIKLLPHSCGCVKFPCGWAFSDSFEKTLGNTKLLCKNLRIAVVYCGFLTESEDGCGNLWTRRATTYLVWILAAV